MTTRSAFPDLSASRERRVTAQRTGSRAVPIRRLSAGRRALLLVLLAAIASAGPSSALAHSELRRSSPASGAVLGRSPERVELVFGERVQLTALRLFRVGGEEIPLPRRAIREADSETIPLPPIAAGAYRIEWRIISADGHPVGGTITFRVDAPAGP